MPVSTIPSSGLTSPITSATITTANVTTLNAPSGVLATQNGMTGIAKAWVMFNGQGTVAIRGSFNVSSITDNGTGDYTVNFTTAMANANYSVVTACSRDSAGGAFTTNIATNDATGADVAPTTSAIRVCSNGGAGRGGQDVAYFSVAVFGS
jgi:hypothetical protein